MYELKTDMTFFLFTANWTLKPDIYNPAKESQYTY